MGLGDIFKSVKAAFIPAVIAFFTGGPWAAAGVLVMAGLQGLLAKNPQQGAGWTMETRDNLVSIRQPDAAHQIIYGERRVGGAYTFIHTAGTNNEFMYIVNTLAGHQVAAIGDPYFDGVRVPLDGNGDATGKYAGHVHVEKNLGSPDQTAFAGLMAALPTMWTVDHRQRGRAGCYLRLKYNMSLFPNGVPNITFDVRGKCDIYDPRTEQTGFSNNAILCATNFLCDPTYGYNVPTLSEINLDVLADSASDCDEMIGVVTSDVTFTAAGNILTLSAEMGRLRRGDGIQFSSAGVLPAPIDDETLYHWIPLTPTTGSLALYLDDALDGVALTLTDGGVGVHTMTRVREPRYTANGAFAAGAPKRGVEALLSAAAGRAPNIGGKWQLLSGRYIAPTIELTESDLRDAYDVAARKSRRDIFNGVKGTYDSPENAWQPSDFPAVSPAAYLAEDDGERIWLDTTFPATTSASACQRIATIELARIRQQITLNLKCKLTAYRAQGGNTIMLTLPTMGWEQKPFEVTNLRLVLFEDEAGMPALGVDLALSETDPTIYEWDEDEQEGVVDISPATNLTIATPQVSGLVVDPGTYFSFGSLIPTWNVSNEPFVRHYQFEGRFEAETEFAVLGVPDVRRLVLNNAFISGGWYFRVKAIGVDGSVSDYAPSDSGLLVEIGPPSIMPRVTGLELRGDGGNSDIFEGNDVKLVWRESSLTLSYELGGEPQGSDSGARDLYFKDFEVRIYAPDAAPDDDPVRVEHTLDPRYDYSFEKNAEDYAAHTGEPGAFRTVRLEVFQRGQQNQISSIPARLTPSNPPPPLPNNTAVTADHHHVIFYGERPAGVLDWSGVQIFISTSDGFTPGPANLVYEGPDLLKSFALLPATTYYVRVRSFDSFGTSGLNESGQYTVTTGQIGTTYIADAAIVSALIADLAVTAAKIANLAVTGAKIDNATITSAKIVNGAITNALIGNGEITSAKIGNAEIKTANIDALQVTTAKIDNNAVTAITFNDGTSSATISVTSVGVPVPLQGSVVAFAGVSGTPSASGNRTYNVTGHWRLRRNGVQIAVGPTGGITAQATYNLVSGSSFTFVSGVGGAGQVMFVDNPSAGTYTYVLDIVADTNDTQSGLTASVGASDAVLLGTVFKK